MAVIDATTGLPIDPRWGGVLQTAPQFQAPSFWIEPGTQPTVGTGLQDYFQQLLYNQALKYLDPLTQRETALWLARDNPEMFKQYAALAPHTGEQQQWLGPPSGSLPTSQQAFDIAGQLSYDTLKQQLAHRGTGAGTVFGQLESAEGRPAMQDIQSGLGWLQEALKTAAPALGTGKYGGGATRQQQNLAAAHLNTLMQEAEREPGRGGMYRTLFENIVNPITQKTPLSGIFGRSRSLGQQSGQFLRRGVSFRNPALT